MKFDPRRDTGKPGIAIMIGVKPSKKDDKKKYGGADGAQPHNVMKWYAPDRAQNYTTNRHEMLPNPIDLAMRGIGPKSMDKFSEEINETDNYDIEQMMEQAEQHEQDVKRNRARELEAMREEDAAYRGEIPPSPRIMGDLTPEQYQIWSDKVAGAMPQQPNVPFEQRLAEREMEANRGSGHNPVNWASEAAKTSGYAKLKGQPMDVAWESLRGE
jgi:hypothetical protein